MASVYAKINIEIIKASSLLGMNIGGTSNPFVKVEIGAKNYTTPTIENTTEPNWREKGLQTQCTFQFPAVHTPTVVTISVYNKLPYGDQLSDFIGQASVTVMKPGQNQQMIPLTHGGNMQLANKAPTGCGMIEVAYDAQEVSESEYFDALLGKTSSSSTVNTPVVPMATIPEPSNPPAPAPAEQQQSEPAAAPVPAPAAVMAPPSNTTNTNTANSSVNSTPMDSTMAPPPPATSQQQEEEPAPVPPPVQTASATEPTPDVSMVQQQQQQQQQTLSQQHQIPSLGSFNANTNNNNNQNNNLPPRAPQSLTLAHSNSGAMPSSFDNNNNQQHVQVQAPSQNNVAPMPEPQAHYAYVPQMNIAPNQNQNQVPSSTNNSARNINNNNQQQRRASSTGRQNQNNSTMSSARTNVNNNHHHHHNSSSVGLMNRSSANTMMNTSAAAVGNSSSIHNNKPKSEKLSVTATRWFDMIRTGGTSAGHALREIRAASEKDPSIVLEACDSSGRTLIHEAAWSGTVELFQELLALAIRAGNSRPTAMSMQLWASEQHNIAAWTTIPSDGYQGPKYVTMNAGNTVLHTAAAAGRVDLVDWMLRQGAVFVAMAQTRNKRGLRPLESAAERGHMETAQVLARSTTA